MILIKEKDKRQMNISYFSTAFRYPTRQIMLNNIISLKRLNASNSNFFSIRRSFFARASEFLAKVDHTRDHSFSIAFTSHDEV